MNKGFSIAEAMITLLIVSLAMAAMAPIMSRQMKREVQTQSATVCYPDYANAVNIPGGTGVVPNTGYLLACGNSNNSWSYLKINDLTVFNWGTSAASGAHSLYPVVNGDTYEAGNLGCLKYLSCRS